MDEEIIRKQAEDFAKKNKKRIARKLTDPTKYIADKLPLSIIVDKMHDLVLRNGQTFLLDGTLSNYDRATQNIRRSLARYRQISISYVYQNPEIAWRFTKAREKTEGRNIPKDVFIRQFLQSRETIERIRKDFGDEIVISLVKKNIETHDVEYVVEIKQSGPQIDNYLGLRYNENNLRKIL